MKPAGIKDIARALDISIGTVDRALHGRSGISAATRKRVLRKAEELGYQPNVAARSLKLNRRLRIGVYMPRHIASFFDAVRDGVRAASSGAGSLNIDLAFRSFRRLDEGDVELLAADKDEPMDGILITPGNPDRLAPSFDSLKRRGVAVICVSTDAPHCERLAAVTVDGASSGAIAAELFSRTVVRPGSVATITGELTTLDHAEKLRGFAAQLALLAPHLTLLPVLESNDQPQKAYRQIAALLDHKPVPKGLYISTANSAPVLQALEERRLFGQVQVIATDLFPDLIPYLESGKILATLHQRPFAQGKIALELLMRYLVEGAVPPSVTRLAPHIVLRSNLALFGSALE
jgi:LacI family transcriptional regulator